MAKLTNITKADFEKTIRSKFYTSTKLQDVFEEFARSDEAIVEYTFAKGEYASAYTAANSLRQHLKNSRKESIYLVIVRKGRVFIIKRARLDELM